MNYSSPFCAAVVVSSLLALAAGCATEVIGGSSGGAGGTGGASTTGTSTSTSTSTSSTSTSTSTSSTSSGGSSGEVPPGPPADNLPDGMGSQTYAVSRLYLGDTNRDGTPNLANAWKQYGYDIDQKISTSMSTDLCKPRNNAAPKMVYPDGNNGIDNSFGRNILPILLGLASDFPAKVNQSIKAGKTTSLFELVALGSGANYWPMTTRVYQGGNLGQPPVWNGMQPWPFTSDSLGPNMLAKAQTTASWVVGDVWVAPIAGDFVIKLDGSGFPMELPIHNPVLSMKLDANHTHGLNGTLAGVIPTDAFIVIIKQLAGAFDPSLCNGPTIDSITSQIAQASDILIDGSQDPTKECDGISVGLGFDAERVQLGGIQTVGAPPNPCGP